MEQDLVQRIKADPDYHTLVRTRSRFGWTLTWAMMIVYYGFTLLVAFNKEFLGTRIGEGVMTWGIPLGLFVIVFTVVITGIYVRRANGRYDELTAAIRAKVGA
ncbi:DUF485 domain-containing protein [Telluria aromaticivorans]|uniref:DUF485 domain-containing protein n=1 Tax=Telluria aromaticivorans TaxID=2725995 RepID=A0A7Y2JZA9_9BURK|nr:DUF485 domain-containing protein [Telluria aromaticivorans]NNG23760.1 DUF485 domain-containing protein [Telluria aromaticivorans]